MIFYDKNYNKTVTFSIAPFSDTKLALSGRSIEGNSFILIINPQNGNLISEFSGNYSLREDYGNRLVVLPDDTLGFTRYTGDGFFEIFDPNTNKLKVSLKISLIWISGLDVFPNGTIITLDGSNGLRALN